LAATFGVFSMALVHLLDAEASNDLQKAELTKRSMLGKTLFLEVVEEGITTLREKCGKEKMGIDGELQGVFDSMCNNVNYESTV